MSNSDSFFLQLDIPKSEVQLNHGDGIVLQGSCFSDEILNRLNYAGYTATGNHFGTIFHPSMLAFNILNCFEEHVTERIIQREDLFFSLDASSTIFGYSEDELITKLKKQRSDLSNELKTAKLLIVTFGTAWGYELKDTNELVANCHKLPQSQFDKALSSPYELVQDWILVIEKLAIVNPELQILFTVSPVRHIRDGMIENNLSKARLLEAVHQLAIEDNCDYFPSYEFVVDILRDYRFYKSDKVHPSDEAVDFVWQKFRDTYFTENSIKLAEEVTKLRKLDSHRSLYTSSEANKSHDKTAKFKIEELKLNYSKVKW